MPIEGRAPRAWRIGVRGAAIAAWLAVGALAVHRSTDPVVLGRWSVEWARLCAAAFVGASGITVLGLPRPLAWLHRRRFELLALALAGLATLALMESAVRALDLLGVSYYEEAKRYHLEKVADEDLVYTHRASWSTRYQGVDVSFNELGFRDDPVEPRADDELRILLLGDSVTFGWGVAQDEIYAARLEARLADALGRPVVVVNTGVGSYNTVQQRAVVERYGDRIAPDLLVLLYVYNDVEQHARPFDPHAQFDLANYNVAGKVGVLLGHSWLYRLVRHVRSLRRPATGAAAGAEPEERAPGWVASMQALADIDRWAQARGVPFVTYVWRRSTGDTDPLWSDLVAAGERGGFPVVETAPAWLDPHEFENSAVDGHPNAAGHERIAAGIARDLGERGWLPPPR